MALKGEKGQAYIDTLMRLARKKIEGETGVEVILHWGDMIRAERSDLTREMVNAEKDRKALEQFKIEQAHFYFSGRSVREPVIDLNIINDTPHTVSHAYFHGILQSSEKIWIQDDFDYKISGGMKSGEKARLRFNPTLSYNWKTVPEDHKDMAFTVTVKRLDGIDGKTLYNSEFSDKDAKRLEEVVADLESLKQAPPTKR